jgi:hypothetical protein
MVLGYLRPVHLGVSPSSDLWSPMTRHLLTHQEGTSPLDQDTSGAHIAAHVPHILSHTRHGGSLSRYHPPFGTGRHGQDHVADDKPAFRSFAPVFNVQHVVGYCLWWGPRLLRFWKSLCHHEVHAMLILQVPYCRCMEAAAADRYLSV